MRLIDADEMMKRLEEWDTNDSMDKALYNFTLCRINEQPTITPERKKGKWIEKSVITKGEAEKCIEEWQSARCNKCGLYHTAPYMYYFSNYNFCPNCGADMGGEQNG